MEKINIALPSDENYVCGLTATAGSIAMHASHDVLLSFHILDGGIKDGTFADFEKLVRKWHPHCEFARHAVNEELFKDFPSWSGNRMTYARLMLPVFMPKDEFCIYCDTDFLWLADIAELWAQHDASVIFKSVPETYWKTLNKESEWFSANGYKFDSARYVCAGLSFYNLKMMREEKLVERIRDFICSHPDVKMADQTAINILCAGGMQLLDRKWQRLTVSRDDGEPVADTAFHFADEIPWRGGFWTRMLTDTLLLWHRVNGKIHGKSTWWSLRQYFGVCEIVRRRTLWYLNRTPVIRWLFRLLLVASGRKSYIEDFTKWNHAANWRVG